MRKGIVLAGGAGSRLYPLTAGVSKQLMPIYNKPMIYYPLSAIMLSGVREILIITTPEDQSAFQRTLGTGAQWGVTIAYAVQPKPEGLAQALLIAENFLAGAPCVMALGDNLFFGEGLSALLARAAARAHGASVFGYQVNDPQRYGVVSFDDTGRATTIEEKPTRPRSHWAVTGLYFYDGQASAHANTIRPSKRGELEITDLNQIYLEAGQLTVEKMGRGYAWFDGGTFDSLLQASEFVRTLETRQGLSIGCLEEIAFRQGWISVDALRAEADRYPNNPYCRYLRRLADGM